MKVIFRSRPEIYYTSLQLFPCEHWHYPHGRVALEINMSTKPDAYHVCRIVISSALLIPTCHIRATHKHPCIHTEHPRPTPLLNRDVMLSQNDALEVSRPWSAWLIDKPRWFPGLGYSISQSGLIMTALSIVSVRWRHYTYGAFQYIHVHFLPFPYCPRKDRVLKVLI